MKPVFLHFAPAIYEHEAMPVGNGRLCAVVWPQSDGVVAVPNATSLAGESSQRLYTDEAVWAEWLPKLFRFLSLAGPSASLSR